MDYWFELISNIVSELAGSIYCKPFFRFMRGIWMTMTDKQTTLG